MITFTLCLLALIVGYFTYGRLMERIFGPDDRKTPALTKADGVDYIPLPTWKIFMIQFLNIAGLGPILGRLWEQNLVLLLIYGSYSEVSLPVLFMIICRNAFIEKRWREFAGDRRSLFGIDHQAGDAWLYGYSNDFGRIGVRCRTGGIIGKTDTGITGYDFLDHCGLCVLYPCYLVAGR